MHELYLGDTSAYAITNKENIGLLSDHLVTLDFQVLYYCGKLYPTPYSLHDFHLVKSILEKGVQINSKLVFL